jgi:hypothetical protein
MLSTLIYFALLQVACALSIERPLSERSSHLQSRALSTNEKVAIGICIPGAALVLGMGFIVLCMYPAQTRKLRKANPGAEIGFAEVMAGKVTQPQQQHAPPKYTPQTNAAAANGHGDEYELPAFQGAMHGR